MKADEEEFLVKVFDLGFVPWDRVNNVSGPALVPRDVISRTGINPKRARYLLYKWERKGWYQYGVSVDTGWLSLEGRDAAESIISARGR
jgi:hypothetical protein